MTRLQWRSDNARVGVFGPSKVSFLSVHWIENIFTCHQMWFFSHWTINHSIVLRRWKVDWSNEIEIQIYIWPFLFNLAIFLLYLLPVISGDFFVKTKSEKRIRQIKTNENKQNETKIDQNKIKQNKIKWNVMWYSITKLNKAKLNWKNSENKIKRK